MKDMLEKVKQLLDEGKITGFVGLKTTTWPTRAPSFHQRAT